jgi:hypothetical protein
MARHTHFPPATFEALDRIRATALVRFDSLFAPGTPIWSAQNLKRISRHLNLHFRGVCLHPLRGAPVPRILPVLTLEEILLVAVLGHLGPPPLDQAVRQLSEQPLLADDLFAFLRSSRLSRNSSSFCFWSFAMVPPTVGS